MSRLVVKRTSWKHESDMEIVNSRRAIKREKKLENSPKKELRAANNTKPAPGVEDPENIGL